MTPILQLWHLVLLALAGWINREQQRVIECLITENQLLKEMLGKNRIILFDDLRCIDEIHQPRLSLIQGSFSRINHFHFHTA